MNPSSQATVIVGGGFVGLFTALHLGQRAYPHPIVLIEPRDRFEFKPLLYELLTGEMQAQAVCPRYADLLANRSVTWVRERVQSVQLRQRQVRLMSGKTYSYGNLVLALGSHPAYFDTPGAAEHSFAFATADHAIALREQLFRCLQRARATDDLEQRLQLLTVVIVGAGPAGVELACTLADVLPVWYENLGGNHEELRIILAHRSNEILKGDINSRLRQTATEALNQRTVPVELWLNTTIRSIHTEGMEYQQHGLPVLLAASTVVWTAGTQPHPLLQNLPLTPADRTQRGQLRVRPTLQLFDYPEVFVGGDCAFVEAQPHPATAQVAYQQGKAIAHNLHAIAAGDGTTPAAIHLRGTLMKLGVGDGVANLFNQLELNGELGHLIRQATYLELLPTPGHNLKTTTHWLADELLQRYQSMIPELWRQSRTPLVAGFAATVASLLFALPLAWRAAQPQQFQRSLSWTGLPGLLNHWIEQKSAP